MTEREICNLIICRDSCVGVSCTGGHGYNTGTPCPLNNVKYCKNPAFEDYSATTLAKKWLSKHKENTQETIIMVIKTTNYDPLTVEFSEGVFHATIRATDWDFELITRESKLGQKENSRLFAKFEDAKKCVEKLYEEHLKRQDFIITCTMDGETMILSNKGKFDEQDAVPMLFNKDQVEFVMKLLCDSSCDPHITYGIAVNPY